MMGMKERHFAPLSNVSVEQFVKRAYLDILCLLMAGMILFVLQLNGGFAPTGNEGTALSVEQAQKYNIRVGDSVLLQLYNHATGKYVQVKTLTVGLFQYFPTSSQDSDFILNRDFMLQQSGNSTVDFFLLKTDGQAGTIQSVATALTTQYHNILPVRIETTQTVIKTDTSLLTRTGMVYRSPAPHPRLQSSLCPNLG